MPGKENKQGYEDIYEPLQAILYWMRKTGVRDVPHVEIMYNEAIRLAEAMQKDITYYYKCCENPNTTSHKWHFKTTNGDVYACSGTTIQKDVRTAPTLSYKSPSFLLVDTHCVFKAANKAVVKGTCNWSVHKPTRAETSTLEGVHCACFC
jgi:hypothetical protein